MNDIEFEQRKDLRGQAERAQVPALWDWFWSRVRDSLEGSVLEAGCGRANLAERIADQNHRYLGVDRSPKLLSRCHNRLSSHPGISFETLDITSEAYSETLLEAGIDTVLTLNTIEHLEDDERFVHLTAEGLSPGGRFVILTPALPSLFGASDRAAGHVRRYSPDTLRALLNGAGFTVSTIHYMNMFGLLPLLWRNFVSGNKTGYFENQSPASLTFHNRIIPLLQTLEEWISPPCGTSLLVKAVREDDSS